MTVSDRHRRGAQLEQKLDSLVHLLAAQHTQSSASNTVGSAGGEHSPEGTPADPMQMDEDEQAPPSIDSPLPHISAPLEANHSSRHRATLPDDTSAKAGFTEALPFYPSPSGNTEASTVAVHFDEIRLLVETWRPKLMEHFPFVVIDPHQTTEEFLAENPFLAKSIAVAALFGDLPRQLALSQELIKELSMHMIVLGEKVGRTDKAYLTWSYLALNQTDCVSSHR